MDEVRTEHKKNNDIDMTQGVIYKQLIKFFIPLLFSSFFQQLYNTADAVIVGRYVGKIALSAVGASTGVILAVFVNFFIAMTGGAAVIVSQYYGAKRYRDVSDTVHTAMIFCAAAGLFVTIAGLILSPIMLRAIGTPEDIFAPSLSYMRIFFFGMTPLLLYNMAASILRAIGDSRRPLYFLIFACLLNIVVDILFVVVFNMGVEGAALATVLCQAVSAVLAVTVLFRSKTSYGLKPDKLKIHGHHLRKILKIGIPSGAESLMYTLANVIVQSGVNGFGSDTVAAWTAYGKIDVLYWMLMASFGTAIMTFVGQNYGAGNLERVKKGVVQCSVMTTALSILTSVFVVCFGRPLLSIFTDDPAVIEIGYKNMMCTIAPAYITYNLVEVITGALRGMGDSVKPLAISVFSICLLRIVWMFTVVPATGSLRILVLCFPISWLTTSIAFVIYYRKKMQKLQLQKEGL